MKIETQEKIIEAETYMVLAQSDMGLLCSQVLLGVVCKDGQYGTRTNISEGSYNMKMLTEITAKTAKQIVKAIILRLKQEVTHET